MKIGNMLFPESSGPQQDSARITEVIAEARRSEGLGMDALWLAEHHFDGNCAYVDPICFAAILAGATSHISIGFAVLQTSLYHPMRLAEQLSLLDIASRGRLIVGLGRGTNNNVYEYQGYGIDPAEAQARYEEVSAILHQSWTTDGPIEHKGRFWDIKAPALRPGPYTRPHPAMIHGASGERSMVDLARRGEPFLMSVQPYDVTAARLEIYRDTMRGAGHSEQHVRDSLDKCWIWRNVFVADSDEEAERVGVPAFLSMLSNRSAMRRKIYAEQGLSMKKAGNEGAPSGADLDNGFIRGSVATVAREFTRLAELGVGGVLITFRPGPLAAEAADRSMTLFMEKIAPMLKDCRAAA